MQNSFNIEQLNAKNFSRLMFHNRDAPSHSSRRVAACKAPNLMESGMNPIQPTSFLIQFFAAQIKIYQSNSSQFKSIQLSWENEMIVASHIQRLMNIVT